MKNSLVSRIIGRVYLPLLLVVLAGCTSNVPAPVVSSGQVPTATVAADMYTVKSGDTVYSIAREHGIDFRELISMNGIENPNQLAVGRVLRVKPETVATNGAAIASPVTSDVVVARPIGDGAVVETRPGVSAELLKREPRAGKEPYTDQALAMAQSQPQSAEPAAKPAEAPVATKPDDKAGETPPAATGSDATWAWPAAGKVIGTFGQNGNKGIDVAGEAGDPVYAAGDGKVIYSGNTLRGYGNLIIVKHNNTFVSAYAHNRAILVKQDQMVKKGQKIAEIGNSDTSQYKLHFEIRRQSSPVDPLKYLPAR